MQRVIECSRQKSSVLAEKAEDIQQTVVLKQKLAERDAQLADLERHLYAIQAGARNQVMEAQRQYDNLARKNHDIMVQNQSK